MKIIHYLLVFQIELYSLVSKQGTPTISVHDLIVDLPPMSIPRTSFISPLFFSIFPSVCLHTFNLFIAIFLWFLKQAISLSLFFSTEHLYWPELDLIFLTSWPGKLFLSTVDRRAQNKIRKEKWTHSQFTRSLLETRN